MANEQTPRDEPDLEAVRVLADRRKVEPIPGRAAGEPGILIRRGTGVSSIGATCSRDGAPVAEGLVVGDAVRGPCHHACASLRAGKPRGRRRRVWKRRWRWSSPRRPGCRREAEHDRD